MVKGLLNVKVINFEWMNKFLELECGVVIIELLDIEFGGDFEFWFLVFDVVCDLVYLMVDFGDGEFGFEMVLCENFFCGNVVVNVMFVVGFC